MSESQSQGIQECGTHRQDGAIRPFLTQREVLSSCETAEVPASAYCLTGKSHSAAHPLPHQ
jgi:hypothetical protein